MKIFYHNDLDGRCAGNIVIQFYQHLHPNIYTDYFEKDVNVFEVDYVMDLPLDKVNDEELVFFVDYSFKENTLHVLTELMAKDCQIIWIDHHTSSLNLCEKYPQLKDIEGIRQDGISGAALTYMFIHDVAFDDVPLYIRLVSDYDCWKYKYGDTTTHFKLGVETHPYDALDKIWDKLYDDTSEHREETQNLINVGKTIKQYIDNDNNYYRDHFAYESEIDGHKVLVVNKKSNSWVFGDRYNDYPLVMTYVFDGTNYTYSIFSSNPDVDCSEIAKKFGGGGHKGAAGFSNKELLFKKV